MNLDLHKLPENVYMFVMFAITSLLGGFIFIEFFFNDFYHKVDNYRLTIFSIAIALPLLAFNTILSSINSEANVEKLEFSDAVVVGSFFTIPVIYIPVLIGFFFHITSLAAVIIVLALEVILIVITARKFITIGKSK